VDTDRAGLYRYYGRRRPVLARRWRHLATSATSNPVAAESWFETSFPLARLYSRVSRIALCAVLVLAHIVSAQTGSASLSGRIINSVTKAGIPGVGLRLCRMHPPTVNSEELTVDCDPVGASAVTDDTGSYHMTGIAEGEYEVIPAVKEGFRPLIGPPPPVTISGDTHSDMTLTPWQPCTGGYSIPTVIPPRAW
jgi:hypothetical protein